MANSLILTITTTKDPAQFKKTDQKMENFVRLVNLFSGFASGALQGTVKVQSANSAPVAASATATLVSCATDTITVGKTTFTGTGTPTTNLHFETDGNDTADAAALAAAINAHPDTSLIVYATSDSNVVTVTALQAGILGNYIAFSETGSTITCTGSGYLTGGTGGAQNTAVTLGR